jgi:hypothetical protein
MEDKKSPTQLDEEIETIDFVSTQITKNIRNYKDTLIEIERIKHDIEFNKKERKDELEKANTKVRKDIIKKAHAQEISDENMLLLEYEKKIKSDKDPYFIRNKISANDFHNYLTLTGKKYEDLKADAAEKCDSKLSPQNRIRTGGRTRKPKKSKKSKKTRKNKNKK